MLKIILHNSQWFSIDLCIQKVQKWRMEILQTIPCTMLYMFELSRNIVFTFLYPPKLARQGLKVKQKNIKCRKSPTLLSDKMQKIMPWQQCGKLWQIKLTFSVDLHIILHCCIGFGFFQVLENLIGHFLSIFSSK